MAVPMMKVMFWMVIVPFCCGLLPVRGFRRENRSFSMVMVNGYFFMLAIFQIIYLLFIVFKNEFDPLVKVYGGTICLFAFLSLSFSVWHWMVTKEKGRRKRRSPGKILGGAVLWVGVILLVGFQVYMTAAYQYPDGDDSFYAVTSVITNTNKNMYTSLPYTGETSRLDLRHAFSSAPIFVSFLAEVCGIHPTIVTHVVFSIMVILLTYMIYKLIGDILLEDHREYVPLFLIFISIMYLFGNDSIYMDSTFLLTRTGQGKAFMANTIPAACILGLLLVWKNLRAEKEETDREQPEKRNSSRFTGAAPWLFLGAVMMTAVYTSMMGAFIAPMLVGGGVVLLAVSYRKIPLLVPCMLSMLPLLAVGLLFLKVM